MFSQLIYFSKATQSMSDNDLEALLAECRRLNVPHEVTGMLLYFETSFGKAIEGRFIQVIEGTEENIVKLFANISKDWRHDHITVLNWRSVKYRDFKDWRMGFHTIRPELIVQEGFFQLNPEFLVNGNKQKWSVALDYLKNFYAMRRNS